MEKGLLFQLRKNYGLTLSDLGGIIHQTVGRFVSTGSSGGPLTYSMNENLHSFRIIDGEGNPYEVNVEETDPDTFIEFFGLWIPAGELFF